MEDKRVRLLSANEIECRVATINEKGVSLLLYKDARVDQRILDETYGTFGWKRSHQSIDGNLYCTVEIYDKESGNWVSKQDVGTVGFAEKEKSQASDSFKRACFNWGIGRELYTAPFIWIPAKKVNIERNERVRCSDHFFVHAIAYNQDREISYLVIRNQTGQIVYEWGSNPERQNTAKESRITKEQMRSLEAELQRTGVGMNAVQERYQIAEPETMSPALYEKVMSALAKTKTGKAA